MDRRLSVRLQKMARLALPFGYCGDTFSPLIRACNKPEVVDAAANACASAQYVLACTAWSPAVTPSAPYTEW